jgi:hypothetical protein
MASWHPNIGNGRGEQVMKAKISMTIFLMMSTIAVSCSQQEFSGDSGSQRTYRTGQNGSKKPVTNNDTKDPSDQNVTANPLSTDDGGKVQLVDAQLIVSKSDDSAAFKNCLYANIVGQPPVEIGCNREAPRGTRLPQKSSTIKLKTNECNQLHLVLYTQKDGEAAPSPNVDTTTSISRFQIQKVEPRKFKINANDNFDQNWNDLNVTIYSENPKIKFTIENSGFPCD